MRKKSKSRMTAKLKSGGQTLTHGGYSFLMKGKLPENRRYVLRYLTAVREGLIRDLGPTEDDLTTAQIILIDRIVTKLGVVRCIEEHVREKSVMIGDNLAPALGHNYLGYINSIQRGLDKLGIHKKKVDETLDVQGYIKQFDEDKAKKGKAKEKMEAER